MPVKLQTNGVLAGKFLRQQQSRPAKRIQKIKYNNTWWYTWTLAHMRLRQKSTPGNFSTYENPLFYEAHKNNWGDTEK